MTTCSSILANKLFAIVQQHDAVYLELLTATLRKLHIFHYSFSFITSHGLESVSCCFM